MKKSGTARGCRNGVHDLSSSRSYLAPMTLHSGCVLRGSTFWRPQLACILWAVPPVVRLQLKFHNVAWPCVDPGA